MAARPVDRPTIPPGPGLPSALYRLTAKRYARTPKAGTTAEDECAALSDGWLAAGPRRIPIAPGLRPRPGCPGRRRGGRGRLGRCDRYPPVGRRGGPGEATA